LAWVVLVTRWHESGPRCCARNGRAVGLRNAVVRWSAAHSLGLEPQSAFKRQDDADERPDSAELGSPFGASFTAQVQRSEALGAADCPDPRPTCQWQAETRAQNPEAALLAQSARDFCLRNRPGRWARGMVERRFAASDVSSLSVWLRSFSTAASFAEFSNSPAGASCNDNSYCAFRAILVE
jgi:hypothetical protein